MNTACLVWMVSAGIVQAAVQGQQTNTFADTLKDTATGQPIIRYAIQTPKVLPGKKHLALMVCFHGAGGSENSLVGEVWSRLTDLGIADHWIVMGLKAKGDSWWGDADGANVRKAVTWAIEKYPIDPRRVFGIGHSSGGLMLGSWGPTAQDLFAGEIIVTGHYWPAPEAQNAAATRTEFYITHGDADNVHPVKLSRDARDDFKKKGYRVVYRETAGYGHGFGPVDVLSDAMLWADALRHKQITIAVEDKAFLAQFENETEAGKLFLKPGVYDELARIGGPEAGKVVAAALESSKPQVRLAAAAICRRTIFGSDVLAALAKLLDDKNKLVREPALDALAAAADWSHEAAREILLSRAGRTDLLVKERLQAIYALGKVIRLSMKGNFKDQGKVFWTLIDLLEDKDVQVRAFAFEQVKGAVADGFQYRADHPSKVLQACIEKWRQWCTEKCGPEPGL